MRPKIADEVPQEDWELFEQVQSIISHLPKMLTVNAVIMGIRFPLSMAESRLIPSCHVFTRALAKFLPVDVHDGIITEKWHGENGRERRHEHSWLTRKGGDGKVIIDPWPLGSVSGPALFIQDYAFHFGNECSVLYNETRKFKLEVAALRFAIRKVLKQNSVKHLAAA